MFLIFTPTPPEHAQFRISLPSDISYLIFQLVLVFIFLNNLQCILYLYVVIKNNLCSCQHDPQLSSSSAIFNLSFSLLEWDKFAAL